MEQVSIGVAFIAGVLSFLSPCVLPLVPAYISFLSGVSLEELKEGAGHKKVLKKAGLVSIFFVLGFSAVFIALGASASFIGKLLVDYINVFTKIAGIAIIVLGLHLLGVFNIGLLNYQKRISVKSYTPSFLWAFLIGLAFLCAHIQELDVEIKTPAFPFYVEADRPVDGKVFYHL